MENLKILERIASMCMCDDLLAFSVQLARIHGVKMIPRESGTDETKWANQGFFQEEPHNLRP